MPHSAIRSQAALEKKIWMADMTQRIAFSYKVPHEDRKCLCGRVISKQRMKYAIENGFPVDSKNTWLVVPCAHCETLQMHQATDRLFGAPNDGDDNE